MKFANIVFLVAGIYGIAVVAPLFFLEGAVNAQTPPPISHPEYYYGFAWVTFVWQFVFLIVSRDPTRYRPMMLMAALEKVSGIIFIVLVLIHRSPTTMLIGIGDVFLGILFLLAWARTAPTNAQQMAPVAHQ